MKKTVSVIKVFLCAAVLLLGFYMASEAGENAVSAAAGTGGQGVGITSLLHDLLR